MTPETKARQQIDQKLEQAGWIIQDFKQLNLGAAQGLCRCVNTPPTQARQGYVLLVKREAVGVIEAKRDIDQTRLSNQRPARAVRRQTNGDQSVIQE